MDLQELPTRTVTFSLANGIDESNTPAGQATGVSGAASIVNGRWDDSGALRKRGAFNYASTQPVQGGVRMVSNGERAAVVRTDQGSSITMLEPDGTGLVEAVGNWPRLESELLDTYAAATDKDIYETAVHDDNSGSDDAIRVCMVSRSFWRRDYQGVKTDDITHAVFLTRTGAVVAEVSFDSLFATRALSVVAIPDGFLIAVGESIGIRFRKYTRDGVFVSEQRYLANSASVGNTQIADVQFWNYTREAGVLDMVAHPTQKHIVYSVHYEVTLSNVIRYVLYQVNTSAMVPFLSTYVEVAAWTPPTGEQEVGRPYLAVTATHIFVCWQDIGHVVKIKMYDSFVLMPVASFVMATPPVRTGAVGGEVPGEQTWNYIKGFTAVHANGYNHLILTTQSFLTSTRSGRTYTSYLNITDAAYFPSWNTYAFDTGNLVPVSKPFFRSVSIYDCYQWFARNTSDARTPGWLLMRLIPLLGRPTARLMQEPVAQLDSGVACDTRWVTNVAQAPDGDIYVTVPRTIVARGDGNATWSSSTGLDVFRVGTPNADTQLGVASLNDTVFVGGSVPRTWTGLTESNQAFAFTPPTPNVANGIWFVPVNNSPGSSGGTRQFVIVYEYVTENGETTQSQSSAPQAYPSAPGNGFVVAMTPHPTAYTKIYGTDPAGSIYYLVATMSPRPAYDNFANYVGGYQTVYISGSSGAGNEQLYTTGGKALEHDPAPSLSTLIAHRNRLAGIKTDDPNIVAYTQEYADALAPSWSSFLQFRVDNDGGPLTALASMADKLAVFQENQVNIVSGFGLDGTGNAANGDFSPPERAVSGIGTRYPRTVVVTPNGALFVHSTGVFQLGFDLGITDIGQVVKRLTLAHPLTWGTYLPSLHQVWYGSPGWSGLLVWDVRYGRWSQWELPFVPLDAVEVRSNRRVFVLGRPPFADPFVYEYSTNALTDSFGQSFGMTVDLPLIRATGDDGAVNAHSLLRCRQVSVVADVFGACTIRLYSGTIAQEVAGQTSVNTWTEAHTFEASGPDTGAFRQYTARLVTSKANGFRIRIVLDPVAGDPVRLAQVHTTHVRLPSRGKRAQRATVAK